MSSQTNSSDSGLKAKSQGFQKKKLRLNYFSQAFQLRYGIWLTTIGVFCFLLMGFLVYLSIFRAVENSPQPEAAREILTSVLSPKAIFFNYEVIIPAFILATFLIGIGIVGTHRIAGPLFAIKRHMNRIRLGRLRDELRLRQGDELIDVALSLNALLRSGWEKEKVLSDEIEFLRAEISHKDWSAVEARFLKIRGLVPQEMPQCMKAESEDLTDIEKIDVKKAA